MKREREREREKGGVLESSSSISVCYHSLSQHHATSRNITQHHATSRSITQHHATSRNITQHHAASRSITQHHAASRSITQHQAASSVPSHTITHHHAPNITQRDSIPINLDHTECLPTFEVSKRLCFNIKAPSVSR